MLACSAGCMRRGPFGFYVPIYSPGPRPTQSFVSWLLRGDGDISTLFRVETNNRQLIKLPLLWSCVKSQAGFHSCKHAIDIHDHHHFSASVVSKNMPCHIYDEVTKVIESVSLRSILSSVDTSRYFGFHTMSMMSITDIILFVSPPSSDHVKVLMNISDLNTFMI